MAGTRNGPNEILIAEGATLHNDVKSNGFRRGGINLVDQCCQQFSRGGRDERIVSQRFLVDRDERDVGPLIRCLPRQPYGSSVRTNEVLYPVELKQPDITEILPNDSKTGTKYDRGKRSKRLAENSFRQNTAPAANLAEQFGPRSNKLSRPDRRDD